MTDIAHQTEISRTRARTLRKDDTEAEGSAVFAKLLG